MNVALSDLLKVVEYITRAIHFEEKMCEQRITFFLALCGASVSVVGYMVRGNHPEVQAQDFFPSMFSLLGVLFLFGLHTLNRMNWRVITIRTHTRRLKALVSLLAKNDNWLKEYVVTARRFEPERDPNWGLRFIKLASGSPAEFMYLTNALIVMGMVLTYQLQWGLRTDWWPVFWCVMSFACTFFILWQVSMCLRRRFTPGGVRRKRR